LTISLFAPHLDRLVAWRGLQLCRTGHLSPQLAKRWRIRKFDPVAFITLLKTMAHLP